MNAGRSCILCFIDILWYDFFWTTYDKAPRLTPYGKATRSTVHGDPRDELRMA